MNGKVFLFSNDMLGDSVWNRVSKQNRTIADFSESLPTASDSVWGSGLFYEDLRYKNQIFAQAAPDIDCKEFLIHAGQVLEDNQRLEYFSNDSEYDKYPYCEQRHFTNGDLSGSFSGVKFRGSIEDVLRAYDDIIEFFSSLRIHMCSISCTKNFDGLTAEIQLEYSDYIVDKAHFTKIVKKHPNLRMMAVSMPEEKWVNWFFFTSGAYSTSLKVENIRYERTADHGWYWGKSKYFNQPEWHYGDFLFFEKERRADVYPNLFNWNETLEYPSSYWGIKPLRFCARDTKYNKKIFLPDVAKYLSYNSFFSCSGLNEIVMPSITKINDGAFFRCKSLKKLVVSEELTCVGAEAFEECSSFEIEAPLGSYAEEYAKENKLVFKAIEKTELL
ncbi:MAG: leucine-rich repeat protein [Clostridia bacterium]|nr:leucine-rich repeat protein [Clostridia bacterium]